MTKIKRKNSAIDINFATHAGVLVTDYSVFFKLRHNGLNTCGEGDGHFNVTIEELENYLAEFKRDEPRACKTREDIRFLLAVYKLCLGKAVEVNFYHLNAS